jgi:hypothetical protein
MENTAVLKITPKADAEYEASVDALIAEMHQVRTQMQNDQREIERLRAETDLILAQIKAS